MAETNSRASLVRDEVVIRMPFRARWPCKAPANFWISGLPSVAALVSTLLRQKSYDAWHELSYDPVGGKTPEENHADYLPSER